MDVVSGPFWYEGSDFKKRHEYYPATEIFIRQQADGTETTIPGFEGALGTNNTYSKNFTAFTYDFNGDKLPDIVVGNKKGMFVYLQTRKKVSREKRELSPPVAK